ncbi:uncharacterized protein LOC144356283 [Saccoglossus kowalevskii]
MCFSNHSHVTSEQRAELAEQLDRKYKIQPVLSHRDSTSSLDSLDCGSSISDASMSGSSTPVDAKSQSFRWSRTESLSDFASTLNVIEEMTDGASVDSDRHNDSQSDTRNCEVQADFTESALEELERFTDEFSDNETAEVFTVESEENFDNVDLTVVVTDHESVGNVKAENLNSDTYTSNGALHEKSKDREEKNVLDTESKEKSTDHTNNQESAAKEPASFAGWHDVRQASTTSPQPPQSLFQQLIDFNQKSGRQRQLSPESSFQLPYENDFDYMMRLARGCSSPNRGLFSRTTSLDSSVGGSSLSDIIYESMDLTPTEDILLNLGFGGEDFAVPERFIKPWQEKVFQSKLREVNQSSFESVDQEVIQESDKNSDENKENLPLETQVDGALKSGYNVPAMKNNGGASEKKVLSDIALNRDSNKQKTKRRKLIRSVTLSSLGSSDNMDSLKLPSVDLQMKASKLHAKSMAIFSENENAQLEQDNVKDRRRKQLSRQKSLPACLETLTEEDEAQFVKSPKTPQEKKFFELLRRIDGVEDVSLTTQPECCIVEMEEKESEENILPILDADQEQYMLAVKNLVESKDSGFETTAAGSDNDKQESFYEKEVCTQTSDRSESPALRLDLTNLAQRGTELLYSTNLAQSGTELLYSTKLAQSDTELLDFTNMTKKDAECELLDQEVIECFASISTQTSDELSSPSLSPLCGFMPVEEYVDQGTMNNTLILAKHERSLTEKPKADCRQESLQEYASMSSTETVVEVKKISKQNSISNKPLVEESTPYIHTVQDTCLDAVSQTDLVLPANMNIGLSLHVISQLNEASTNLTDTVSNSSVSNNDNDKFYCAMMSAINREIKENDVIAQQVVQHSKSADFSKENKFYGDFESDFETESEPSQVDVLHKSRTFHPLDLHKCYETSDIHESPISKYLRSFPREFRGGTETVLKPNEHIELNPNGKVYILENMQDDEVSSSCCQGYSTGISCQDLDAGAIFTGNFNMQYNTDEGMTHNDSLEGQPDCFFRYQRHSVDQLRTEITLTQYEELIERFAEELVENTLTKVTAEVYESTHQMSNDHLGRIMTGRSFLNNSNNSSGNTVIWSSNAQELHQSHQQDSQIGTYSSELFINVLPGNNISCPIFEKVNVDDFLGNVSKETTSANLSCPDSIVISECHNRVESDRKKDVDSSVSGLSYEDICLKAKDLIDTLDRASAIMTGSASRSSLADCFSDFGSNQGESWESTSTTGSGVEKNR